MKTAPVLFALGLGCTAPSPPSQPDDTDSRPVASPMIDTLELVCDLTLERWQLDVRANAWTGGAEWWWTVDGTYVEKHDVTSRKAASDGTWDELRLRLDIVADWRDAVRNASTPFLCASEPTGRLLLRDMEGTVVDCFDTGPHTDWLSQFSEWPECP